MAARPPEAQVEHHRVGRRQIADTQVGAEAVHGLEADEVRVLPVHDLSGEVREGFGDASPVEWGRAARSRPWGKSFPQPWSHKDRESQAMARFAAFWVQIVWNGRCKGFSCKGRARLR